ncbi:DUF4190 domain-containing protein [Kribbella solani]|uniref:DUF4190 domain-containing protein n=1 Tax=Kribbella solani TaxID=236067 RepID=A0A841DTQ7_9ACTN|nr:DUF4190 domain-containing protein [Kribbella solani]MBB5981331.1 hypothetical protein [Kribbella solani]MDX2974084.1 DUF4190 domain-containing protein [Kribbella solani]MDX3006081.1 DUF4190 domain-containing protein [Kribbella solani]
MNTSPIQPARPSLPSAESWLEGVPEPKRKPDGYAVAALATSLPGLVPLAVVLGLLALRRIKRTGSQGKRLAQAALLLSLCWVIAIGVAVTMNLIGEQRAGIGRTVPISKVEVGRCFDADLDASSLQLVRIADCAGAHSGEAYAKVPAALAGLPTAQTAAVATQQCAGAFVDFVGKPYERSELDMYYVVLENRAVADGNVLCLVGMPGTRLTGTMRGSQR